MKLIPFADTLPVFWILILITASVAVHAGFVSWGAAVAGIGKAGFGRALAVTLIGGAAAATVAQFGHGDAGTALGAWSVGFALQALVTSAIYRTSLRKAAAAAAVAVGSSTLFWMTVALVFWLIGSGEHAAVVA